MRHERVQLPDGSTVTYKVTTTPDGVESKVIHSEGDEPALVESDGTKEWYTNGVKTKRVEEFRTSLYDEKGVLCYAEWSNGTKAWYRNGGNHRDNDLPAVEHTGGGKIWCIDGKRHRDNDLPAVTGFNSKEYGKKCTMWYRYGKLHRDGGKPAVQSEDGKWWFVNGELHRNGDEPAKVILTGDEWMEREWYKNGYLHRDDDKPARVYADSDGYFEYEWHIRGKFHRENDKPASIYNWQSNWWVNGLRHRLEGPAIISHENGEVEYWVNGEQVKS